MSTLTSEGLNWNIFGSLCVERKPIITRQVNQIEKLYSDLLAKMELENSLLNDHELRHIEDVKRNKRIKAGEVTDADLEVSIQTAQDFEDLATEELNRFQPASRKTKADEANDLHSLNRSLDRTLLLMVKPKHSSQWELPTCLWKSGETLRQTSERSLKDCFGTSLQVCILGNAPIGFYKFKYSSNLRKTEIVNGADGGKVFFFRAHYVKGTTELEKDAHMLDYTWATREEIPELLASKQAYLGAVGEFLAEEEAPYTPSEVFAKKFSSILSSV